jgi:thiol-disulfide isomerase/thioredoxin
MQFGRQYENAPELRVAEWLGAAGNKLDAPIKLSDLGAGTKILFAFQHWCPGCHSRGFPTLQQLHAALVDRDVGFAAIQTVFEGAEVNTLDKLRLNQERYRLAIPFGHDVPAPGDRHPSFMEDYRSAGTPWFTIINPEGKIVFADFRLDADRLLSALDREDLDIA